MASSTVEDYVKAILNLSLESPGSAVSTGALAKSLGVSDGTASKTIRSLAKAGLVDFSAYTGAALTAEGRLLAMRVLRKHRLIELFLTNVLDLEWDAVHAEAEELEHAVSDRLAQRIDDFLSHPLFDPHGDPIPTADGEFPRAALISLVDCEERRDFVVGRILDQSRAALQYLSKIGVRIGVKGQIRDRSAVAGVVSIDVAGRTLTFAQDVAENILVKLLPGSENADVA